MTWPCTVHQGWWRSIWSQLTFFHSEAAAISNCNDFFHRVKFRAWWSWLTIMTWFVFVLSFLEGFLWWPQTFECDVCCFPVRIWDAVSFFKPIWAVWAPMMKFMVTHFGTFLVWSMSLSVEYFFVINQLRFLHLKSQLPGRWNSWLESLNFDWAPVRAPATNAPGIGNKYPCRPSSCMKQRDTNMFNTGVHECNWDAQSTEGWTQNIGCY